MKLLLDTCVWGGNLADLQTAAHDVMWAGEWSEDPADDEILGRAHSEGRILVTLDKDFRELAIVRKIPHCGILRLVDFSAKQQAQACLRVLSLYGLELQTGAIVTAEPGRLRYRPPEK